MPVHPDTPEPLKTALGEMESVVQSTKRSLAYAAPEVQGVHWAALQNRLAGLLKRVCEDLKEVIDPIGVLYKNHRGEISRRRVIPQELRYGATEYHPEVQFLLDAYDVDKQAVRTFALKDCNFRAESND